MNLYFTHELNSSIILMVVIFEHQIFGIVMKSFISLSNINVSIVYIQVLETFLLDANVLIQ